MDHHHHGHAGGMHGATHHDMHHAMHMDMHHSAHQSAHHAAHHGLHHGTHHGHSTTPMAGPIGPAYTGPATAMSATYIRAQRYQFISFALCGFGVVFTFAGIGFSVGGSVAGFIFLPLGLTLLVSGIIMCFVARKARGEAQAIIAENPQQGPVVTGYTPVTGGGIVPPPGQAGPPGPTYNTGYQPPPGQPGSTYNPGYPPASAPGAGYNPGYPSPSAPGSGYNPGYPPASAPAPSGMAGPPSYEAATGEKMDEKPLP